MKRLVFLRRLQRTGEVVLRRPNQPAREAPARWRIYRIDLQPA